MEFPSANENVSRELPVLVVTAAKGALFSLLSAFDSSTLDDKLLSSNLKVVAAESGAGVLKRVGF